MLSYPKRLLGRRSEEREVRGDSDGDTFEDADEVSAGRAETLEWLPPPLPPLPLPPRTPPAALIQRSFHFCCWLLQVHLHPDAHEDGGLACTNLQLLEAQRRWVGRGCASSAGRLVARAGKWPCRPPRHAGSAGPQHAAARWWR